MRAKESPAAWANEELGRAKLGNVARTRRLVKIATVIATVVGGQISKVFTTSASREAAYRFFENDAITARALLDTIAEATWRRAEGEAFVYVPIDGSSITITDTAAAKGTGQIGSGKSKARGLKVMNAIALNPAEIPLGLLEQKYWVRTEPSKNKQHRAKRKLCEKETGYWVEVADTVLERQSAGGFTTRPWFQLDREGDFRQMLQWGVDHVDRAWLTARAHHNRRLAGDAVRYLWPTIGATECRGQYELDVSAGPHRTARRATMSVRFARVELRLRDKWTNAYSQVSVWAVLANETSPVPDKEKRLEWMLLTTYPVESFSNALDVVRGYSKRWSVEEFHRTWKTVCGVEQTQLRAKDRIAKWAVMLGTVAMRIERLKHLGRKTPDEPASVEFSREEIDAVILLREPKGYNMGDMPTVGQMVRWVADLGGYTGKSSGGPPGTVVLNRGLDYIASGVKVLEFKKRRRRIHET